MLKRTASIFSNVVERFMPDPFIFAAILSFVVYGMALGLTEVKAIPLVDMWAGGLWSLLTFTMQISLTLLFSGCVVRTRPVRKMITSATALATTPAKAYFITALLAGLSALFSWAAGLMVGAFTAKEMAKNVKGCHYPLLVASAYSGFMIWHMGYSSSIGLVVATPGHFLEKVCGIIPTSETIFAPFNMITAFVLLISIAFLMPRLAPDSKNTKELDLSIVEESQVDQMADNQGKDLTFADRLESAWPICLILALGGLIYLIKFYGSGGSLNLNSMNMSLLVIGLIFSKNPKDFVENAVESGKALGPILIQFPLYGGIMGMMIKSGLAIVIAGWFVAISTEFTLPFWAFMSAGLINFFVPSGGSQWAVQGPIMLEAAQQLSVDMPRIAMAVAWGDQWTNLIQPFWALPLLAIAGMKAKDMMGYCIITLIWSGIVCSLAILLLP